MYRRISLNSKTSYTTLIHTKADEVLRSTSILDLKTVDGLAIMEIACDIQAWQTPPLKAGRGYLCGIWGFRGL